MQKEFMEINNRVKELRKYLHLSQENFGDKIGLKKAQISKIETGGSSVTGRVFDSICREFRIRAAWLREGTGEMFEDDEVDELTASYHLDAFGASLVREYLRLNEEQQAVVRNYFYNVVMPLTNDLDTSSSSDF